MSNSTLSDNHAPGGRGGGIFTFGYTLMVINNTLLRNSAFYDGGGIYNEGSSVLVTNSTLSGNSSASSGGDQYSESSNGKQQHPVGQLRR